MSNLLDTLTSQLRPEVLSQISGRIGANPSATQGAVQAALPVLLAALARNAARPEGAASLSRALERDHDGGVLDDLGGFVRNPEIGNGTGILRHVLGERRPALEGAIGQASGLDAASVARLLPILAPLVMAALGRAQRQQGLDTGGLAGYLQNQGATVRQRAPSGQGALLDMLDSNKDGSVADDLLKAGLNLFNRFSRQR